MMILTDLEKTIPNLESRLWLLLSILDPNIHSSLEEKLKEVHAKRDQEELEAYLNYANILLDIHDQHPKELFDYLVTTMLESNPNLDKVIDVNRLLVLESFLSKDQKRGLEKFHILCLKNGEI
jgi:hypothetical protein